MKRTFIPIYIFLVFTTCDYHDFEIVNLNNNEITVLGHGGMGVMNAYPVNSFESITNCLNLGADGTELDVQMTKDGVLVAFHDLNLAEYTNLEGSVNSLTWAEIKKVEYKYIPYLNYSIISLDQLFSNTKNVLNYKFTFDCILNSSGDDSTYSINYIKAIGEIVEKHNLHNNIYIESKSAHFLKQLKDANPLYKLFIYPATFNDGLEIATELNLYGVTIANDEITKNQILVAHNNDISVTIWGVRTNRDNYDAIKKNPDFIQTDKLKHLIKVLK